VVEAVTADINAPEMGAIKDSPSERFSTHNTPDECSQYQTVGCIEFLED
jgi:hypothetical protein